jgi:hypothetical protein
MSDHFPQMPPGGSGRLRAMLANLKEDQTKLDTHPLYKEGWDDGYNEAKEKYRQLVTALANIYNVD